MIMKVTLGALCATVALAAAAQASAAPSPAAGLKASKNDPNRMVCKTTPVTGTRFAKSVCLTKQEWDDKASRDKAMLSEQQQKGFQQGTVPPN
jgi:hypothetical protein